MAGPQAVATSTGVFSINLSPKFVKCATVSTLGIVTIGAVFAATEATAVIAIVFFSALALFAGATSIASVTAAFSNESDTVEGYFSTLVNHLGPALAGTIQVVAQATVQALVQRATNHIAGPTRIEHSFKA